jgi:hypothetical protein
MSYIREHGTRNAVVKDSINSYFSVMGIKWWTVTLISKNYRDLGDSLEVPVCVIEQSAATTANIIAEYPDEVVSPYNNVLLISDTGVTLRFQHF